MKLRTFIALVLLLPALFPEAAALRAQSSRNSFPKVSVGDIRYVDKAHRQEADRRQHPDRSGYHRRHRQEYYPTR